MPSAPSTRDSALAAFPLLPAWDRALFEQPTAIYRGAPFWSWNGPLDRDRLTAGLEVFRAMGLGGAHLHPRTGLATPYLGDDFMRHIVETADDAEARGLLTWLYDEDRWPSGAAGGLVTRDPAHRCRSLRLTRSRPAPGEARDHPVHHNPPVPVTDRVFVAAWALRFEGETLAAWRRLAEQDSAAPDETALYAYLEVAPDIPWFNHQQYANLLDPRAIARFLEITHDRYAAALGDRFGRTIPAIFTDEPLFRGMDRPVAADDPSDLFLAWVDDLPETYRDRFNEDLLDRLPAVLFDAADGTSPEARLRFRDHHTQRFVDAFAAQVGRWCEDHHLALTGHMMAEQTLADQSRWCGEVMRSLAHFHLPGIDMLCDAVEYTTAKQAQSIARQFDRPGVMSELYGVTNWDFPLAGHLRQGNWQAALGITIRVHHLTWYSMAGEAKRDYPASIGAHSPWWPEYPAVEDHFARLGVALQTGRPRCRVAMLHPIESQWIAEGPRRAHADTAAMLERGYTDTLTTLLENLIDTDLIAESLLPQTCPVAAEPILRVGAMAYHAIILPPLLTIRRSTLDRLDSFAAAGGTVISLGPAPALVDGRPDAAARAAAARWHQTTPDPAALLAALSPWREVELLEGDHRAQAVVHQLRDEPDGRRILFLCSNHPHRDRTDLTLRIRGHWHLETLDTATGATDHPGETWAPDGWTEQTIDLPVAGHHLLRLHPATAPAAPRPVARRTERARLDDPVPITLHEPNLLLLDRAAWRLDHGAWQPADDILRIDNHVRTAIGLPPRTGNIAQPWADPPAPCPHRVTLGFDLRTDLTLRRLRLGLERAADATITCDGHRLPPAPATGHFIDPDIPTLDLPDLPAGTCRLEITWPFDPRHGLEACYLLGDFSVALAGRHATLKPAPRTLAFGDCTVQGLPFYGGNLTYHTRVDLPADRPHALHIPHYSAALLTVDTPGRRLGRILRPTDRVPLPGGATGPTDLNLTAFGTRFNTFGQLHNANPNEHWWGPASWRTTGPGWTDTYLLRPTGILSPPIIETHPPHP